jgi:WD40 repeat protein
VRTGEVLGRLGGPCHPRIQGPFFHGILAFAHDDRAIASAGEDGRVVTWDCSTWRKKAELISPDASTAEIDPEKEPSCAPRDRRPAAHDGWVRAIAFSPDGRLLATAGNDHLVRLWEPATAQPIGILGVRRNGVPSIAISSRADRIATHHEDGMIRLWDPAAGAQVACRPSRRGGHGSLAFHPRDSILFAAGLNGSVEILEMPTLRLVKTIGDEGESTTCLAVSSDGERLVWGGSLGSGERRIQFVLWNLKREIRAASIPLGGDCCDVSESEMHLRVALSPNGLLVASPGGNGIDIWQADTGTPAGRIEASDTVISLAFSPDGCFLAAGMEGFEMFLHDLRSRTCRRIPIGGDCVASMAFSPDGREIAVSTDYEDLIRIHDVESGAFKGKLVGHVNAVRQVAYASGGQCVVTGGGDGLVKVWNAASREEIATLIAET